MGVEVAEKRPRMPTGIVIDRKELRRLYLDEGKTTKECAEHFGVTVGLIATRLKRFGIRKYIQH